MDHKNLQRFVRLMADELFSVNVATCTVKSTIHSSKDIEDEATIKMWYSDYKKLRSKKLHFGEIQRKVKRALSNKTALPVGVPQQMERLVTQWIKQFDWAKRQYVREIASGTNGDVEFEREIVKRLDKRIAKLITLQQAIRKTKPANQRRGAKEMKDDIS